MKALSEPFICTRVFRAKAQGAQVPTLPPGITGREPDMGLGIHRERKFKLGPQSEENQENQGRVSWQNFVELARPGL